MLGVRIVKEQNVGQDMRYYELLDQLVSAMTAAGEADVSQIEQILGEIARLFRLCKGVTRLYRSLDEEKEGGGETFCSFDIGEGEPVAFQRVVTSGMAIATMTVYMQSGIRPLSSEERRRVELIMRLTLSFVCRNRMQRSITMGTGTPGACRTISCRQKERAGLWASRLCGIICAILRW